MRGHHKVVLVGHDKAPSVALELVGKKLKEGYASIDVVMHCANGGPPLDATHVAYVGEDAATATLLVTGVSSSAALGAEEIASAVAVRKCILSARAKGQESPVQYGVYLDTDMGHRHWFDDMVADEVSFAFAPNAEEAALAQKRYPKAHIFLTGNPLEESAAFPKTTREEIRTMFELHEEQPLIVCPGGKDLTVNKDFLEGVVYAILHPPMPLRDNLLLFSPHPGDLNDPTEYLNILEDAYYHARLVPSPQHIREDHPQHLVYRALLGGRIHGDAIPCSNLIPGCDIVVQSASTIGKEAGRQRKPVVNYFTAAAYKRNPDLLEWPPVARGVEEEVYEDPSELGKTIARLLTSEGYAPMRVRQEAVYLKPAYKGEAVDKMMTAFREILGV